MDFFLNIIFGAGTTEARTESEEQQGFVDADDNGNNCVVA